MVRIRRPGIGLLIVALTASMLGFAGPVQAAPAPEPAAAGGTAAAAEARGGAHTVTLLTGDKVTVLPGDRVRIQRAEGRDDVSFVTRRIGGHLHVVPSDAVSLLNSGRLDKRLFDVTTLIEFGYHDGRGNLPLILTGNPAARGAPAAARVPGVTSVRDLPAVDGVAVRADTTGTAAGAAALWRSLTGGGAPPRPGGGGGPGRGGGHPRPGPARGPRPPPPPTGVKRASSMT